jgi:hypothetical protein
MDVLNTAVEAAEKNGITTIAVASTSGETAAKLFEVLRGKKVKMIVVTYDQGRLPPERRFRDDILRDLLENGVTVYAHRCRLLFWRKLIGRLGLNPWYKHLRSIRERYGTGIKVCHIIVQMLMEGGILREGKVVAIAGEKKGADSAAIFVVSQKDKWPILEEIISSPSS